MTDQTISMPASAYSKNKLFKFILLAGLIAGTLDLAGAIIYYCYVKGVTDPARLLKGIASGALGKDAFSGGNGIAFLGVIFHYVIAMTAAAVYFFIYPRFAFFRRQKIAGGLLYGLIVWSVMNLIVLPLSAHPTASWNIKWKSAWPGIALIVFCIGIPIALVADRYFKKEAEKI